MELEARDQRATSGSERHAEQERVVATAAYQRDDKTTITLQQVVPVRVHGRSGTRDTFALLDPGAQTSLCSNELADELNIPGECQELCVQTVEGAGQKQTARRMTMQLTCPAADATKKRVPLPEVWAVPRLNISMPRVNMQNRDKWRHLEDFDVSDCTRGEVKLLLGANVMEAVVQHEVRAGPPGQPVAIRTDFGWALTGAVHNPVPETSPQVMHVQRRTTAEDTLAEQVQEWLSTEAFGTKYHKSVSQSREDERALSILEQKTRKSIDRFETGMLWKEDRIKFPDNRGMALKRLEATE